MESSSTNAIVICWETYKKTFMCSDIYTELYADVRSFTVKLFRNISCKVLIFMLICCCRVSLDAMCCYLFEVLFFSSYVFFCHSSMIGRSINCAKNYTTRFHRLGSNAMNLVQILKHVYKSTNTATCISRQSLHFETTNTYAL